MKSQSGFLGVNHPLKSARVVIIPVPWEKTTSYRKGTARGPEKILRASEQVEFFDEELGVETSRLGINTRPPLRVEGLKPETVFMAVAREVKKARSRGQLPVVLGGEHSVSLGAVRGLEEEADFSVLYFDAHPDLRDKYEKNIYNHACAARRIREITPNLVIVGARTLSREEDGFLKQNPVPIFWAREMMKTGWRAEKVVSRLRKKVYLSIDLDGFDSSLMPAVGNPEPGGVGWYEFLFLVRMVSIKREIIGFDLVELCPRPGQEHCDFTAARLVYRVIGYALGRELKKLKARSR